MPLDGEALRAPLAKPEPRKRVKARDYRKHAKLRKACRAYVMLRSDYRCERCGLAVSDDLPESHPQRAHVNERVPRSLGGSDVDVANLELICQHCHIPNGRHAPTPERQAILTGRRKGKQ